MPASGFELEIPESKEIAVYAYLMKWKLAFYYKWLGTKTILLKHWFPTR